MNRQEEWRDIPGYEGLYQVSDQGRVRRLAGSFRCAQDRILKTGPRSDGYVGVNLYSEHHRQCTFLVHALVARVFLGPRPENADINHIDANKANNSAANLEYCSRRRNIEHSVQMGLNPTGERNGQARLTADQVEAIRRASKQGVTGRALARQYKISPGQISRIVNGHDWKHVS